MAPSDSGRNPPPAPTPASSSAFWQIVAVFVGGMTVNWLSDLYEPTPIIVLAAVVASFVVLLKASPEGPIRQSRFMERLDRDFVLLALGAVILGVLVGSISIVPIFPSTQIPIDNHWVRSLGFEIDDMYTSNYECGAFAALCIAGIVASIRGAGFAEVASFGVAGLSGMLLVYSWFDSSTHFAWSLVAWALTYAVLVYLTASLPDLVSVLARYWRLNKASDEAVPPRAPDSPRPGDEEVQARQNEPPKDPFVVTAERQRDNRVGSLPSASASQPPEIAADADGPPKRTS